jgi:cytochrome c
MKLIFAAVAISALMSAPAFANADLAKKNACMACHAVDKKLVGPSYNDVAKKYAGQKDAEATLAKSIKAGGSGKWGPVPMPAQAALSDADAPDVGQMGFGWCQISQAFASLISWHD